MLLKKLSHILELSCTCSGSSIWLEHPPVTREVAGSSPVRCALNKNRHMPVFVIPLVYSVSQSLFLVTLL